MTQSELERWTRSRISVPDNWQFHSDLGLLPSSFVNQRLVKKLFKGPKDYNTRLVKEYESFVVISKVVGEELAFDASEAKDIVNNLLRTVFGDRSLSSLDGIDKGRLCVTLSDRYGLSPEVISKTLGMSTYLVNQFLRAKDFRKYKKPSGQ